MALPSPCPRASLIIRPCSRALRTAAALSAICRDSSLEYSVRFKETLAIPSFSNSKRTRPAICASYTTSSKDLSFSTSCPAEEVPAKIARKTCHSQLLLGIDTNGFQAGRHLLFELLYSGAAPGIGFLQQNPQVDAIRDDQGVCGGGSFQIGLVQEIFILAGGRGRKQEPGKKGTIAFSFF